MDTLQIIRLLAQGVAPKNWTVSDNGVRKGPVSKADCGLQGSMVWLEFHFEADGKKRTVKGSLPVTGGEERIVLDGMDVDHDDIVLSNRVVGFPPKLVLVVEFKFGAGNSAHRIRFDGKL